MRFTQFERSSLLYRGGWNPAQVAFVVSIIVTIISSLFGPRQGSRVVGALPYEFASCRSPICLSYHTCDTVSLWGGRLASQRDVAFGSNFPGELNEYNRIPNLLNEGGCRDNRLHFTQKSPVIPETFGTGTPEFLRYPEGFLLAVTWIGIPCSHILDLPVAPMGGGRCHEVGKCTPPLWDDLGSLKSDCLSGSPLDGGMTLWHEYLTRDDVLSLQWVNRLRNETLTLLETFRGTSLLPANCSHLFVRPPKGLSGNKSPALAPEGTTHNERMVLKESGRSVEPRFVTSRVIIFECVISLSLLWTSSAPSGFMPGRTTGTYQKFGEKKSVWDPKGTRLEQPTYFDVNFVAAYLWLINPTGLRDGLPTGGRDAIMAMPKALPQSPDVVVFVD